VAAIEPKSTSTSCGGARGVVDVAVGNAAEYVSAMYFAHQNQMGLESARTDRNWCGGLRRDRAIAQDGETNVGRGRAAAGDLRSVCVDVYFV
jgi:hypothetical protein